MRASPCTAAIFAIAPRIARACAPVASTSMRSRSVGPGEGREMPVIPLAGQIEIEPESVHLQFLGLGQGEAAPSRVPRIVDVNRLAAAVARQHAVDLESEQARHRGAPVVARNVELDRLLFEDAENADEGGAGSGRGPARN